MPSGSDYDAASAHNGHAELPYSLAEIERIRERQRSNIASDVDIELVHASGGRLVTTPNGMLVGLGGAPQDIRSRGGGTTYGDIFLLNIDGRDTVPACVSGGGLGASLGVLLFEWC